MNGFLPFEPLDAYESLQLLLPPYSLKLSEPDLRSFIVDGFVRRRLVLRGRFEEFGHTRVMRSPEEMTIKSFLATNIPRESVNPIYKGDAVGFVVDETEQFYTKDDKRCLTELADNVELTFVYNRPTLRQPFLIARDMARSVRYLDSVGEIQDEVSVVPHDTNTNIFAFLRTGAQSSSFLTEAFELAVDRKSRFGYSDEALLAMKGLALIYRILKRLEDAKNVLSRALDLSYSTQVVSTKMRYELLYDFAALYLDHGDTNSAEIQFSLIERHYRDDNADKFHTLCSKAIEGLATIALEKGLLQQAESLFRSALEQNFGDAGFSLEHTIKSKLGMVYCAQGQLDRAYRLCEESLEYQKQLLGDRHYHSLRTMHLLAGILFEKISLSEAEHFYVHELSGLETLLGPNHLDTLKTKELLACVYRGQSRFENAHTIWKNLLHTYESLLGPEHFCTMEAQLQLCQLLGINDRLDESVKCLKSLCEMTDRLYGPSHSTNRRAKFLLANVYHKLGNFTSYESIRDQIRESSDVHGTNKSNPKSSLANLEMRLDTLLGQRLEGTCEWIFEEQSFRAWIDSPPSSTFWIQGGPGTGKSVLTSAIIERLRKNRCPTIFFHFDQGDSALSDPKLFLDSLIAQMLQFDRRLSEGHGIFQGQAYTPISKSFAKFSELALKFEELYCCVDAIEECGTSVELLLYLISDMARSMAYPVKFLVSSRSTPESLRCMENFSSIVRLPTDGTRKDVQQLAAFQLKKTKSPDDVYRQFEIDRLTSAANGMFLWLNLVLKGAEVSGTVSDPYKRSLPEVYRDSVLSLTRSQTLSENELLCTILYWTTTALRPLKVNELQIALAVTPGDTSLEELKILSAPHQAIQKIGGHLIEIESNNSVVQVHQSLISFLKTADCPCILVSPEISIPIKPERSHAYLGAVCITYLSFGCFQDPYKPHTQDIHTFLYYAASFWHLHTIRAGKNKVLAQRVLAFLGSDQGFNWLDALMTIFGKSVEDLLLIQFQISAWLRQFDEDIGSEGGDFVLEAYRIRTARFGKTDSLTNQETTMLQNFADLCQAKGLFHESERLYHRVLGTNEDSNIAVRLPKGRDKSFANTETEHSATPPNLGGSPSSLSLDKESNNSPSVNMKTSHGSLTEGGSDDLRTKSSLALTYRNQGRWKEAEELEFQVTGTRKRELGKEHPLTLMSMDNLASTYHIQGRWKEAEELEVQVLETRTRIFGDEHPDTLTSMGNLALTYHSQGRWKEAEELEVQVLETRTRIFGDEHPDTLTSMGNLASTYHRQGRWDEAEELEVQVMRMRTRVLGKQHPDTLASMNNLALALSGQGKYPEAEKMYQETLALQEIVLGKEHPNTLTSMNNLAQALSGQGKYLEAEKMHRETLALGEKVLGKEHPGTLTSMNNLADALSQQGKYAEAEKMYNETLALQEMILGIEHPDTLESISNLAQALSGQGKYAEAEKMHHETLALQKMILGKEHPSTLTSMSNLARVLSAQGKYTEAISAMQQCFQLQTKILGSHHPHTKASRTALDKWQIRP